LNILAKSKMCSLVRSVDEKSRQIITYLSRERYAGIRKLGELVSASSDMEVLIRIREVINPKAREIIGKPIITFEHSKIDPLTGEKIMFSWWLKEELVNSVYDNSLDIINEENVLRVIASLPPQEEKVETEIKDDFLIISGKEYYKQVPLFCHVEKRGRITINNGVLEVKLNKMG
jgi:hypothetical protein